MKHYPTLLLLIFSLGLIGQNQNKGKILDSLNKQPLAFVNVIFNGGNTGISSDIDGKFELPKNREITKLTFSSIGYKRKTISVADFEKNQTILLNASQVNLSEVVITPGENPAHRIINLAVENKKINNPEKATEFFYESYNKLVFTAKLDSALRGDEEAMAKLDSSSKSAYDYFEKRHLFLMESISERNHLPPDHSKELVKASRISGLQNPIFSLLGTQLQSFSLYTTYISLFGEHYLSPISQGSVNKYLFVIEDTLYKDQDTVFTISFRPRKGKNFDGLKGFISINSNLYAVENFIAEPFETASIPIKIQQKYQFIENKQWFPVQLNTFITFNNVELNNFKMLGIGRSYLKNIQLKSKLTKSEIGNIMLKMDDGAGKMPDDYWNSFRQDTLDAKEQSTYHYVDSIGKEAKLDQKILVYKTLLSGNFPIGIFDFPLNRLIDYNGYEGLRLGLGMETNDKVIKWLRVGGYGAYGFKDSKLKYGYHARWLPKSNREFEIKGSFINDLKESGGVQFFDDKISGFSNEAIQKIFINQMDKVEKIQFEIKFRALRDFKLSIFGNQQVRKFNSDYTFLSNDALTSLTRENQFRLVEGGINFRYAFREKLVEMFGVKIPVPSKYPIVHVKYTRGFDELLEGDFKFNRIDFKVDQHFLIRNLGKTSIRLAAGMIDEIIPITTLYRSKGTYDKKLFIASSYSFETMAPNEFFSDRFVNVFVRHSFENLLFKSKNFKPELTLTSAFAIGDLKGMAQHGGLEYSSLEKGFYESGFQIDNLLQSFSLGVGAFYRYGPYSSSDWKENYAVKVTSSFSF